MKHPNLMYIIRYRDFVNEKNDQKTQSIKKNLFQQIQIILSTINFDLKEDYIIYVEHINKINHAKKHIDYKKFKKVHTSWNT